MQRHDAGITRTSDRRRARTLAGSLVFVLAATAFYANGVKAAQPGEAASAARTFTFDATAAASAGGAQTHWDAARRECVDVPGAVATAALSSSLS